MIWHDLARPGTAEVDFAALATAKTRQSIATEHDRKTERHDVTAEKLGATPEILF